MGTCKPGDGKAQELTADGVNAWRYGDIRVRLHASNYEGKHETFYFDILKGYEGIKDVNNQGSAMIMIHDAKSGADTATSYPAGTERDAIIEVTHAGKDFCKDVSAIEAPAGLRGFEFTEEAGRKVWMVQNITGQGIEFGGTMKGQYGKAMMIESWDDQNRASVPVSGGKVICPKITIPAYGHVLVVNSDLPVDFTPGHLEYDQVFRSEHQ
jgi:hypothetical protein